MISHDLKKDHDPQIIQFEFKRDYVDFILIEMDRFNQPMTKTLLSFLNKRYGSDFWYCIDISGDNRLDCYVIAGPEMVDDTSEVIHVYSIAVRREFEGQGWAKKILFHLIEEARKHGKQKIILEVRDNNERAINFYQHLGFDLVGRTEDYYDEDIDALNYEYIL